MSTVAVCRFGWRRSEDMPHCLFKSQNRVQPTPHAHAHAAGPARTGPPAHARRRESAHRGRAERVGTRARPARPTVHLQHAPCTSRHIVRLARVSSPAHLHPPRRGAWLSFGTADPQSESSVREAAARSTTRSHPHAHGLRSRRDVYTAKDVRRRSMTVDAVAEQPQKQAKTHVNS